MFKVGCWMFLTIPNPLSSILFGCVSTALLRVNLCDPCLPFAIGNRLLGYRPETHLLQGTPIGGTRRSLQPLLGHLEAQQAAPTNACQDTGPAPEFARLG